MGFTDEYLALRAKRKKTTGNSFDDEYLELRNQRIAEEEIDDIAPVKTSATQTSTKKEEEDEKKWYQGWLQKGAFKDGYQFGDITKTLLGTDTDIATNAISGIVGWGENAVDAVATKIGEIAEKHGKQDTADKIRDFTTKDLYDEKDVSRKILSSKLVTSQLGSFGTAIRTIFTLDDWLNSKKVDDGKGGKTTVREDASILGDNADGLISSAGETVAKMGLTAATGGIPVGDIITGVTGYGSQAEQALKDGATFKQASGSGLISAGAEIMFEKLSGGIKIGGKALDDGLTQLISKNISNVALKNGVHLFKDVAGESLEEVLTEFVSKLGTKLYKEEDLADILFSEESLNDYIKAALSGGLMGGAFSGARVANSVKTGRDYGTGLTANEQKVVDKEIENRIAEEERCRRRTKPQSKKLCCTISKKAISTLIR